MMWMTRSVVVVMMMLCVMEDHYFYDGTHSRFE
jgi:hypothetical protein